MQRLVNRYRSAIHALSKRTNTPVPSLVASFLILHEVTAIVPFTATFFIAKYYGLGHSLMAGTERLLASKGEREKETWLQNKLHNWTDEATNGCSGLDVDIASLDKYHLPFRETPIPQVLLRKWLGM